MRRSLSDFFFQFHGPSVFREKARTVQDGPAQRFLDLQSMPEFSFSAIGFSKQKLQRLWKTLKRGSGSVAEQAKATLNLHPGQSG